MKDKSNLTHPYKVGGEGAFRFRLIFVFLFTGFFAKSLFWNKSFIRL